MSLPVCHAVSCWPVTGSLVVMTVGPRVAVIISIFLVVIVSHVMQ